MVGGESAGGGLCAALCTMARDKGKVHIAYQMPLYPMLDNLDTESSADNYGKVWNTKKNHLAWKLYLRKEAKSIVSPYAAPARETNYTGHAFDMMKPEEPLSKEAARNFNRNFEYAMKHYFAHND